MTSRRDIDLSVVVPVFRNKDSLTALLSRLSALCDELRVRRDAVCEVVFVDDGSDDGSWEFLQRNLSEANFTMELLRLTRNFGQVNATLAGLEVARGKCVAFISADLQDAPELLLDMYESWLNGAEVVVAQRVERDEGLGRRLPSRLAYGIARLHNPSIPSTGFDYALLDRVVVDRMKELPGRHRFLQGDILWFGYRTVFVPYRRVNRQHGKSQWTWSKRWKYFIDIAIDGSYVPIQAISRVGIVTALLGLIYACVVIVSWLMGATPFTGWAPIMITILLVGGLIMTMLGVIGEYLWRIYDDIGARPNYVIREHRSSREGDGRRT